MFTAARYKKLSSDISTIRVSKKRLIARRFFRNRPAAAAVGVMVLLVLYAVLGPHIGPWSYTRLDFLNLAQPPSADHWLGTDASGGDLFAKAAHGLGRSLMIGVIASVGGTAIAAVVGTALAYIGGTVDKVGVWILDMAVVVPTFFVLAIVVKGSSQNGGWLWLTAALMLFYWFLPARVFRSAALSLREREYITASRYMGFGTFSILRRHLIPNLGSILIINVALGVVTNVEAETGLSFIGFGVSPPDTSLGLLIKDGSSTLLTTPWLFLVPASLLVLLCLSMQLIADGLRDALDPSSESGGKA